MMKIEDLSMYISGPIANGGHASPEEIIKNVQSGEDIYGALIEKGWNPECPHMSYYPDKRWRETGVRDINHESWLQLDRMKVWKNKYFFYMTPEKYGESGGAKREYEWAKQWGKKIFTSLEEVPNKIEAVL